MGSGASRINKEDDDEARSESMEEEGGGGFFSAFTAKYIDPPMPSMGKPVDFEAMLSRTVNVKRSTKMLMRVVGKDSIEAYERSLVMPVSKEVERIKVTEEVLACISQRKNARDDKLWVRDNLTEVKRALSLRRSSLNMMNHNYSQKVTYTYTHRNLSAFCTLSPTNTHTHTHTHAH